MRKNKDYILFAGVWFRPVKPPPSITLRPVLDELQDLYTVGLDVSTSSGRKKVRAKLLLTVCDLPARAMVLNQVQHNGYYTCAYCLDKGVHVDHRMLYLPSEPHTPRTHASIQQWASEADSLGDNVFGVKGKSILAEFMDVVEYQWITCTVF